MSSQESPSADLSFAQLGLIDELVQATIDAGFEVPTPIQARTIPPLLEGRDLIGQAQTGTGKTAAFALPMLQAIDPRAHKVQGLVLAPTRELAIQVAEELHAFGKRRGHISVLPVYGGQPIHLQLKRLNRGVHVVVGTPGRILDHLHRGSLSLSALRFAVLDEADEMLRMGFIDDVQTILDATPAERQTALFSATLPSAVHRVAQRHLHNPVRIDIAPGALTVPKTEQRYLVVPQVQKLEVLSRLLETEDTDAVLVFVRTRTGCAEVADKLQARGHAAEALHGDMSQWQRERVVEQLRSGRLDVVIATDVAARGLDVDRIGHVINLDAPHDVESYVHRIGRTGRAGRVGKAVLFLTPGERRFLRQIERVAKARLQPMNVPSRAEVFANRVTAFKAELAEAIGKSDLDLYRAVAEDLVREAGFDMVEVASAAMKLARAGNPLVAPPPEAPPVQFRSDANGRVRLVLSVGFRDGVRPGNIVGAIANEGGVPGKAIGAIDIHRDHCFVDIPAEFVAQVLHRMADSTLRRRPARVRLAQPGDPSPKRHKHHKHHKRY